MRAVVQLVRNCSVSVDGTVRGENPSGLLVYLGVGEDDSLQDVEYMASKLPNLRIFPDDEGLMNLSVLDTGGGIMVISQFTLYGDARKGRRPSYSGAADPQKAEALYSALADRLSALGIPVSRGVFRTHMSVSYVNEGPVTILLDSRRLF